ncbi:hypothetical protein PybrP1_010259 [[Pythium] brassicae (nom. inval.)]|nr:hypothetical protein PybrP1_010259 [[Pythium] brassicae (nom. inval.)]
MRVKVAGAGDAGGRRARPLGDDTARFSYSGGNRSKLQLQCSDGRVFDVTHEEAMMSSTLWMLLQDVADKKPKTMVKQHMIPIFDVPSNSVELALFYCRCLYKQQVEGHETALHAWDDRFLQLDSKTLCDLAKVASHLDIQPLVDLTCRSIAQIMSATEAAHEIRQKFGLEDAPGALECSCELRNGMAGFDFDMFNSLDHDLSTEEYELVEFDQPSVDELVSFINGSGGARPPVSLPLAGTRSLAVKRDCHVHAPPGAAATTTTTTAAVGATASTASTVADGDSGSKKKKKNKKKKRRAGAAAGTPSVPAATASPSPCTAQPASATSAASETPGTSARSATKSTEGVGGSSHSSGAVCVIDGSKLGTNSSPTGPPRLERHAAAGMDADMYDDVDDEEDEDESEDAESSDETSSSTLSPPRLPRDLQEKMRLARQNPSAIFCESQFEEDDEETQEQLESFRRALESAHLDSRQRAKLKPRVQFAPQDVFRSSTLAASQRQSSQFVSTAI